MKVAETSIRLLEAWVQDKLPTVDQSLPVEVHALAQGYELRCGDLPPFQFRPSER